MADSKDFMDWFGKAEEDLSAARILFEQEGPLNSVAFHIHQAVEKSLKAYLVNETGEVHKTHSIGYLSKKCSRYDRNFKRFVPNSAEIDEYYIETRYPSDIGIEITIEEISSNIEVAEKIIELVRKNIF